MRPSTWNARGNGAALQKRKRVFLAQRVFGIRLVGPLPGGEGLTELGKVLVVGLLPSRGRVQDVADLGAQDVLSAQELQRPIALFKRLQREACGHGIACFQHGARVLLAVAWVQVAESHSLGYAALDVEVGLAVKERIDNLLVFHDVAVLRISHRPRHRRIRNLEQTGSTTST